MQMPNLPYLWLAARLKLRPNSTPPRATFAGVTFAVEPEHYQLRGVLKQQAIQPVLAQLLSLCDAHTLFVDIGANVGLFSLLVASETGAQVMAFEPVRSTFHALVRNCSLNPALPITPLNLAMGAAPQVVEITAVPGSGINQVASVAERQGEPRQPAIQLSLDQLCLQELAQGFQKIVIKIDVERYEFEVLAGMQIFLESNVPIALCVEVEQDQRSRLQSALGSRFRAWPATAFRPSHLAVSRDRDLSNVFFVNEIWKGSISMPLHYAQQC
jgi:FkbM family methyltransferase